MGRQVWAVSMMKDEADVAAGVLWHMAEEAVDGIIVADNLSTDGTYEILKRTAQDIQSKYGTEMVVLRDEEVGYYQSKKMTNLARMAAERGAEWIIPFDADELWFSHLDRIALALRGLDKSVKVAAASLYNHFPSGIDPPGGDPFTTIEWRQPEPGYFRRSPSGGGPML